MADPAEPQRSFEEFQLMARDSIVTHSQAINLLRRLGELLLEEGNLVRAAGVFRSLEVLTGEPYRPMPRSGAQVVQMPKPLKPEC